MKRITARVSQELFEELERAAEFLGRSQADLIRQAIAHYLDDLEDLSVSLEALRDSADPILDWEDVRVELLA